VSWSRRIGVAVALLVVAGGSIAFAGTSLVGAPDRDRPSATAPPPPAPTLLSAARPITRGSKTDVTAVRPLGLRQDQQYRLRVYVNGEKATELDLPDQEQFVISDVDLVEGDNEITASLIGDGGESADSAPISVVRDDRPPVIRVSQPGTDETVYADSTTLLGRTEPGADISITDARTDISIATSLQPDGHFSAALSLDLGNNPLVLRSTDAAGNRSSVRFNVVRAVSEASVSLSIAPTELFTEDLPATIEMTARVRDELDRPVDGAQVTFSVSPPTRETMTYRTTSTRGVARWNDLVVDPADSTGVWLIGVLAVLPSGLELRDDESFSLH